MLGANSHWRYQMLRFFVSPQQISESNASVSIMPAANSHCRNQILWFFVWPQQLTNLKRRLLTYIFINEAYCFINHKHTHSGSPSFEISHTSNDCSSELQSSNFHKPHTCSSSARLFFFSHNFYCSLFFKTLWNQKHLVLFIFKTHELRYYFSF